MIVRCVDRCFSCIILSLLVVASQAEEIRTLVFNSTGKFKIALFADLHFGEDENTLWGPKQDVNSTRVMNRMLTWEKPNLVVYSGDQITGENIGSNATSYWAKLVEPCVKANTPWTVVFGNHDDKSAVNGTREDLLKFDTSYNLSVSKFGPNNIHGLTNYYHLIYPNATSKFPAWALFVLDSGGGSYPELVYDDQIEWLKKTSDYVHSQYGPLPAIGFFHIPSTGYESAYRKDLCSGTNNDTVAPQVRENGLLKAFRTYANVSVTFVGHNHGNDWCCPHMTGLLICYARHTGYGGYGTWARGSRIIVLDHQTSTFESYVRMENGDIYHN